MRKRDLWNPGKQKFLFSLIPFLLMAGILFIPRPAYGASVPQSDYLIDVWETDQGLPEDSATAMVQTPDGYLWFGTFNGLVRFDGVKFTVFDRSNTPELPSAGIVNLYLDRSGRLWVSTLLGIAYVKDEHWRVFHESDGWVGNFAWRFAETASGDLYLSTFDHKMLRFRDDRFWQILPPPVSNPEFGFQLCVDGAEELWVVHPQFIGKLASGKWQEMISTSHLLKEDALATRPVLMAAASRDGGLWVATRQHLYKYLSNRVVLQTTAPWPMESFWSVYEDSRGGVWIASSAAGLYHFSAEQGWQHLAEGKPLPYHSVRFVFEDREHNLWVGTSGGGLVRVKRRYLTSWGPEQGLPERVVKSLTTDGQGRIYFGTWGKGVARLEATRIVPFLQPHDTHFTSHDGSCRQLFDGLVLSTLADREGRLWVSTYSNGLFLLDGHTCRSFFASAGTSPQVAPLFEDSQGKIWIGTEGGGFSFNGKQFQKYPFDRPAESNSVRSIAEDAKSKILWAGNNAGGLFRFDGKQFAAVPEASALASERIIALLAEKDGTLWIGTENSGLACLRDGRLTRITEQQGLPARTVASILDDQLGNVWFGSEHGILRASRSELEDLIAGRKSVVRFQVFTRSDGLPTLDCSVGSQPASARDRDGKLWFATYRGVVAVDPRQIELNPIPPPVVIENVIIDGKPANVIEQFRTSDHSSPIALTIPPGDHRIEVHYAGLSYTAPEKVRFRYILEGSDKEWNEVGDRRIAYFYQLRPGRYRLRVLAANNDGLWNSIGVSADLYVRPFFYQTYNFLGLCVLAVVVTGTGAYRWRIKRLRKHETELEELVSANARELQERKRVEAELRRSEDKFAKAFRSSPAAMSMTSLKTGQVIDMNETFAFVFGFQPEEVIGHTAENLGIWEEPSQRERVVATLKDQRTVRNLATQFRTKNGRVFDALFSGEIVSLGNEECLLSVALDITEQKRLEQRLRQSQKMEAVGKLAGGVAHDFNNLLTVIRGYSHIVLDNAKDNDLRSHAEKIDQAAERAAALTSQLLAFSRRQVLQPKIVDLNALVLDLEKMLHRLIGEDIEMVTFTAPDLGRVRADPGQIEQVIMNLAVNARDAMPGGGKLLLETANVELDQDYVREHVGAHAGPYVMLAVSDTGIGMNAETTGRIFEPFFTTKEIGKGTGLGLSMVYGIVRQSGGNIWVYSEPGKGTTFKVYLPRVEASPEDITGVQHSTAAARGTETILLVEDDRRVRELACTVLNKCGYRVLVPENSLMAPHLCDEYNGSIHLLLTDVVMPGMSGKEVARHVIARRPEIKVLYMSGYTTNTIVHHGELDGDSFFLPKPFTPDTLAAKVREVLDWLPPRR